MDVFYFTCDRLPATTFFYVNTKIQKLLPEKYDEYFEELKTATLILARWKNDGLADYGLESGSGKRMAAFLEENNYIEDYRFEKYDSTYDLVIYK